MSVPVKLAAFAVALVAALGLGYGVGAAIGPDDAETPAPVVIDHGH